MTLDHVEAAASDPVEELYGIGATARASGLAVGTLRFYDGAGLLRPASVDPRTGYRYYTDEQVRVARLLAVLRAAGMPLAGIRAVLRLRADPAAVDRVCVAHLRAMEHELADARRLLSTVGSLLDPRERPMEATQVTVDAGELAAALRAVRYAAATDPELPALRGVLVDLTDAQLTVVATDRYRLATAVVAAEVDGPSTAALVPTALVDGLLALLDGPGPVTLTVAGLELSATTPSGSLGGALPAEAFPDYRALLRREPGRTVVAAGTVRAAVAAPPARSMAGAGGQDRAYTVLDAGPDAVWVDREFLREALDAGRATSVELTGPSTPLTLRGPGTCTLLMPALAPAD